MTTTYEVRLADLQEQRAAVVCGRITRDQIADFLGGAFGEVMDLLASQDMQPAGPPFARYRFRDDGILEVDAGFPVPAPVTPAGRVEASTLPGGRVATTMHVGDYAGVGSAYDAASQFLTEEGYEVADAPWECYLDDPDVPAPRTEVFMPCRPVRAAADRVASVDQADQADQVDQVDYPN
ncbi:MAG TPA: GyrI-like domain-containing protein [Nocardioidaceae bacterium]|nr:GyrI-like domain-containing protein [Nocardioidaceae bacterium]